jgi:hypothetical protein
MAVMLWSAAMFIERADAGAQPVPAQLLPITAIVDVQTLFGDQHVIFVGWMAVDAGKVRQDNGIDVFDLRVTKLHLIGPSQVGALTVSVQDARPSIGEVRALQSGAQFPASSFIDLYPQISAPDTPIGALVFHNEAPLHLVSSNSNGTAAIATWPPLGVEYRLQADGCVAFLQQGGEPFDLALCVTDVRLDIAPALSTFSVGRNGPSRLHPADLLGLAPQDATAGGLAPFVRIPCASLGLTPDGCDGGSDGTQDNVVGLSFGQDIATQGGPSLHFAVAPGAEGAPGSAVRQQHDCPPSQPGLAPEAESDIFSSSLNGGNQLLFDGNGPIGTCPVAFPLGLIEAATVRDSVDAIDMHDVSTVDTNGDGVPDQPVYFTLDADSPSLRALGLSPGDILETVGGQPPVAFATASRLGLRTGDEIAAFCLKEDADRTFGSGDVVYFALTPRSPSLAAVGAGPGDILSPGNPLRVVTRGSDLGLAATDALGALSCETPLAPAGVRGDVNCDQTVNEIDAALVLQYEAGLLAGLPCFGNGDVSRDGMVNSIDALLILQLNVGLIDRLP